MLSAGSRLGSLESCRRAGTKSPDLAATAFTSPVPLLKRLIGIEARAKPNEVGPPIAVAVIDAPGGLHFVEQGACQLAR